MTDQFIHNPVNELLAPGQPIRGSFEKAWNAAKAALDAGLSGELAWKPKKTTRSTRANACMWAHLADLERQVEWHGQRLSAEEWKEVMSAGLRKLQMQPAQRSVPSVDGTGYVMLGVRTSRMSVAEMGALIELITAFGNEHGVRWTAPKWMYG